VVPFDEFSPRSVPELRRPPFLGDVDAIVDRIEAFTKESWREIEPDR
jgi:hypothetical protein